MNHAEDRLLFLDLTFVPLVEKLAPQLPSVKRYVVLTDAAHMPATPLPTRCPTRSGWRGRRRFRLAEFDENTAAGMCYTSGTTGNPKGVLYSHRSNVLHSMMAVMPDVLGLSMRDVVDAGGADVPCQCLGARLLRADGRRRRSSCPAPSSTAPRSTNCSTREKVTFTAAVPTVWLVLLQLLEQTGKPASHLRSASSSAARPARAP